MVTEPVLYERGDRGVGTVVNWLRGNSLVPTNSSSSGTQASVAGSSDFHAPPPREVHIFIQISVFKCFQILQNESKTPSLGCPITRSEGGTPGPGSQGGQVLEAPSPSLVDTLTSTAPWGKGRGGPGSAALRRDSLGTLFHTVLVPAQQECDGGDTDMAQAVQQEGLGCW